MTDKQNLLIELYNLKLFGYKYINKSKIIKSNINTLPNNIEELNSRINNCNLCELSHRVKSKTTHKNSLNNKIVVIVPYILNEKQNKILQDLLYKYLNINIDDVLVLNLIKCDINNLIVNEECFVKCKEFTIKQLEIVNPKFIFSFGDIYKLIVEDILKIGEKINYNNSYLYYLDELEYILRNPSSIDRYTNTFRKIKNEMEKI
jgi:DNA polymerase